MLFNKNLKSFENFFFLDNQIRELLSAIAPNPRNIPNKEDAFEYGEKIFESICLIENSIYKILTSFKMEESIHQTVSLFFYILKQEFMNTNYDYGKMVTFYQNHLSAMSPNLISKVKRNCWGYNSKNNNNSNKILKEILADDVNTINELLHAIHSYITNNENYYENVPVISKKSLDKGYKVILRGKKNELTQKLFEEFPTDMRNGHTDILSLNDRILMMIRDKGHALMIEIDGIPNDIYVKYSFPKICNHEMVNELKGIEPVNDTSTFAKGIFRTDLNNLLNDVFELIRKVPTDEDIIRLQK